MNFHGLKKELKDLGLEEKEIQEVVEFVIAKLGTRPEQTSPMKHSRNSLRGLIKRKSHTGDNLEIKIVDKKVLITNLVENEYQYITLLKCLVEEVSQFAFLFLIDLNSGYLHYAHNLQKMKLNWKVVL